MGAGPARAITKTLLYCKICLRDTSHEIHLLAGAESANCLRCEERTVCYELDRE